MTTDVRIECPLCGRHRIVRTTGAGKFLERKAAKRLREHQEAGCFGWTPKRDPVCVLQIVVDAEG